MSLLPNNWLDLAAEDIATIAPLQPLDLPQLANRGVTLSIKREDLLHPLVGGNKVYKLWGHLKQYRRLCPELNKPVASYGGAFSNHLLALAWATHSAGIPSIGIIRGEQSSFSSLSPTLKDCQRLGMRLHFVSREAYRQRATPAFEQIIEKQFGPLYWVPEGGGGPLGALGCMGLAEGILCLSDDPVHVLTHACGTGSSLAGLIAGAAGRATVMGFSVLKGYKQMEQDIQGILDGLGAQKKAENGPWAVNHEFHAGGYAKLSAEIGELINSFASSSNLLLDPVYTGKEMMGILTLVEQGEWPEGTHLVMVHSGGLQGLRGYASLSSLFSWHQNINKFE